MNTYSTELCHHGILGQRWGRKNGPPYPLGASDHSASEKKAGWHKSLDKMSDDELRQKVYRKNLENQYNYYSTKTGKSRQANDAIDVTKKGFRTAGNIANTISKGLSAKNQDKIDAINRKKGLSDAQKKQMINEITKGKKISDVAGQSSHAMANGIQKQGRVNLNKKDVSKMSDSDLKKAVNRMMLESQYMDAYYVNKGKERAEFILDTVGAVTSVAGTAVSIALLLKGIKGPAKQTIKVMKPKML